MNNDGEELSLQLRDTTLEDSGKFVCTAFNEHGKTSADFHLLVQGIV